MPGSDNNWLRGPVRQVRDVTSLDEAKECAEEIVRGAWNHGFTADLQVDAMSRLLDQVARVAGNPRAAALAAEIAAMSTDGERTADAGCQADPEVREQDTEILDALIEKARSVTGGKS